MEYIVSAFAEHKRSIILIDLGVGMHYVVCTDIYYVLYPGPS